MHVDCDLRSSTVEGLEPLAPLLQPGAVLGDHEHVRIEQSWVLEGSIEDDEGVCGPGQFVWRPAGSRHAARSPGGALVLAMFLAPNRFLAAAPAAG